ncbi:MAG: hypothetical protein OER80_10755 [Gammaproteobacteria bacterium]|nr:hypothetical protein [Gammaproteobacteria bacterium]MDH3768520.1 hypothetical protein [Gammaproteobacteria bacterium]
MFTQEHWYVSDNPVRYASAMQKLALFCVLFVTVNAHAATVTVSPPDIFLNVGEETLAQVFVSGVESPGLTFFQFDLVYDPTVINLFDPNDLPGSSFFNFEPFQPLGGQLSCETFRGAPCLDAEWFLTSTGRGPTFFGKGIPASTPGPTIDNTLGRVSITYLTEGDQPPAPTGTGALAIFGVRAVGSGDTTINFENVLLEGTTFELVNVLTPLIETNPVVFDTTSVPGMVTVAPIPVPAAFWLFGSTLGLLGWLKRRE